MPTHLEIVVVCAVGYLATTATAGAEVAPFELAPRGCPMVHCDGRMSDNAGLPAPTGEVDVVWKRDADSLVTTWISSNGSRVAYVYGNYPKSERKRLFVRDYAGDLVFTDDGSLSPLFHWSGPLIGADGGVMLVGHGRILRYDPTGTILWDVTTSEGMPISASVTEDGILVVGRNDGPLSIYDTRDGRLIDELWVKRYAGDPHGYDTINTPAVRGRRIYNLMERNVKGPNPQKAALLETLTFEGLIRLASGMFAADYDDGTNPDKEGRLVAFDITDKGLEVAWTYEFGAPSGASPLVIGDVIYFDGDSPGWGEDWKLQPMVYALRDLGSRPELLWSRPVPYMPSVAHIVNSFEQDPRGGIWNYVTGTDIVVRLDETTGAEIEHIAFDPLLDDGGTHSPCSGVTIAGTSERPYMMFSVMPSPAHRATGNAYLVCLDLADRNLEWAVRYSSQAKGWLGTSGSQPVILVDENGQNALAVTATVDQGAWAIGQRRAEEEAP
jgi:hypothetical protein